MRSIILISLVLLIALVAGQKFDCAKQLATVTTPRILRKCLGQIPYNKAEGDSVINNFRIGYANSSLTPLFATSLEPFKINSDILGELDRIQAKAWKSYFEFHLSLQRVISNTRDAHLTYQLPSGFDNFELIRPYQITVEKDGTRVIVRLKSCVDVCNSCSEDTLAKLQTICEKKLTKFLGKEIVTVNGENALTYFLNAAQPVGDHTDLGGRFNRMLSRFTVIQLNDFYKSKAKGVERFVFAGEKPNNTSVRILANNFDGLTLEDIPASLTQFADTAQATIERFLLPSSSAQRSLEKLDPRKCEVQEPNRPPLPGQISKGKWKKTSRSVRAVTNKCEMIKEVPIGTSKATLYHCNYKTTTEKVQLLTLPTFSDSDEAPGYEVFLAVVQDAISSGITKLIVDVTGNGGGNGCLAYVGVSALTTESPTKILQFYTARKTPGMRYIYRELFGDTNAVSYDKDGNSVTLRDFWDNSADVKYAFDPTSNYLEPFYFCNNPQFTEGQQLFDAIYQSNTYTPATMPASPLKQVIVLTNGVCYSACSIFVTNMRQLRDSGTSKVDVKTILYGGEPGQVFDGSNVATNILSGTPTITWRPMMFNTNAEGTTGDIRQFTRLTADGRIDIWSNNENQEEIWSLGIDQFTA